MKLTIKILLCIFTLALVAGVFVCATPRAFAQSYAPWNVVADISHNGKTFRYNLQQQLAGGENAQERGLYLSARGKKQLANRLLADGLPQDAVFEYLLPNFREILQYFHFVNVQKRDATVTFDANGFAYSKGVDGVSIDVSRLFWQMLGSGGRKISIDLPLCRDNAVTVSQLKQNTVFKAQFTTYFAASNSNRVHNVALATEKLNGVIVGVNQKFSFNEIVGARTEENGYLQSKIILDGMYTDGVGGGVCQVSTTLYNALLLAEVVPMACQHSLASSYVMAGFDAMVSDCGADLTFVNNTEYPLYIAGRTDLQHKSVTFTVYGKPNCYKVVRESVTERNPFATVEIVDRQRYPELVFADQYKVVVSGSDGVKSQSYLNYYDGDTLVKRQLIRQNTYKRVDRVVARGNVPR